MFYDNFCKLCNDFKKSPSSVVESIGLSRASITAWRDGAIPRKTTLMAIAEYFGVSISDLLAEDFNSGKLDGKESAKKMPVTDDGQSAKYYLDKFIEVASFEEMQKAYRDLRAKLLGDE